jgi:RHS repeat-associated protein
MIWTTTRLAAKIVHSSSSGDLYQFTGDESDSESSTYHTTFRQLSPSLGRWLRPDPYDGSYNLNNPQSLNRYSYVMNNPLAMVDPSGQFCVSAFPYGNAEEPYIDPFINSAEDCGAAYGTWYDTDSTVTVTTDEPDPMDPSSGPGLGAVAVNPSSPSNSTSGVGSVAPSKPVVLQNPCVYMGRALPPSGYAMAGKQANGSPVNFFLDVTMGFPGGGYLDPQPLGSGNPFQNQAYGNYTFGVYMQSAGLTLSHALSGANGYAAFRKILNPRQYANQTMDSSYPSLPAASVSNITNGFNAQSGGTACHN